MHPNSPYKVRKTFDLKVLYGKYESLRDFVVVAAKSPDDDDDDNNNNAGEGEGDMYIDFKKEGALYQLTKAMLDHDFGLVWSLPAGNLCPTVPNRCNYLCWLAWDLVGAEEGEEAKRCLDVGIGASCIYPLLGTKLFPRWSFVGTDISPRSLEHAKMNIKANGLEDRIDLFLVPKEDDGSHSIFTRLFEQQQGESFDVTMCNPPFYETEYEIQSLMDSKEKKPFAAPTGLSHEMITEGGEFQFVSRMIKESKIHPDRSKWYSTMFGKKSTFDRIQTLLIDELKPAALEYTILIQGSTRRWVLAWSWIKGIVPEFKKRVARERRKRRMDQEFVEKSFEIPAPSFLAKKKIIDILDDQSLSYSLREDGVIVVNLAQLPWVSSKRKQKCIIESPFDVMIRISDDAGGADGDDQKIQVTLSSKLASIESDPHAKDENSKIKGYFNSLWKFLGTSQQK